MFEKFQRNGTELYRICKIVEKLLLKNTIKYKHTKHIYFFIQLAKQELGKNLFWVWCNADNKLNKVK